MYTNTPIVAYAKKMAASDYNNVAFSIAGVKKDVSHIIKLGDDNGVDLAVVKTMYGNVEEAERLKGDHVDVTSIVGGMFLLFSAGYGECAQDLAIQNGFQFSFLVVRSKAGLDFDLAKKE